MGDICRNVLLKIAYNGMAYHGFAYQPGLSTVEWHIFNALIKSKLVTTDMDAKESSTTESKKSKRRAERMHGAVQNAEHAPYTLQKDVLASISQRRYYKCGRTDAGVSATEQYVSIRLPVHKDGNKEYPYDAMINQHMPSSVRVHGWMYVEESFSARFSCVWREYEYYMVKDNRENTPDIEKMREAAKELHGTHWFGRLSRPEKEESKRKRLEKRKVASASGAHESGGIPEAEEAVRTVDAITFELHKQYADTGIDVYIMRIRARSFLHNQVRKIYALLHMIGTGADVDIKNILNRDEKQRVDIPLASPQYLVLSKCMFDGIDTSKMNTTQSKKHADTTRQILKDTILQSEVGIRCSRTE